MFRNECLTVNLLYVVRIFSHVSTVDRTPVYQLPTVIHFDSWKRRKKNSICPKIMK